MESVLGRGEAVNDRMSGENFRKRFEMTIPEKPRDGSIEKKGKSFFVRFDAPEAASVFSEAPEDADARIGRRWQRFPWRGGPDRAPSGSFPEFLGSDLRSFEEVTLREVRCCVPLRFGVSGGALMM